MNPMVTFDEDMPADRNPLAELHAAQRRRRWIAYAVVLTSSAAILLILKWVVERI
jgi:hypothetical protein